jgi:hypothetical protein
VRGGLVLALALAGPAAARDRCLAACDEVMTGAEAAARAQSALGVALPPGAAVAGLVEGGFQDAFVQARIEVPRDGLDAALKSLGTHPAALRPDRDAGLGPPGPAWWEDARQGELRLAPAAFPGFAHAVVAVTPGDGSSLTLLLWAFQT